MDRETFEMIRKLKERIKTLEENQKLIVDFFNNTRINIDKHGKVITNNGYYLVKG